MTQERRTVAADLARGGVFGMIAGVAMAMFAMIASATYQHHGFFTPLFHISALTGTPAAMMTSVGKAGAGNAFWFTPGAAIAGLVIHMAVGAAYGMAFGVAARYLRRALVVPAGMLYGIAVFALSSFAGLPLAARITGAGPTITHMARIVGYLTFAVEHLMFGLALGVLVVVSARSAAHRAAPARRTVHAAAHA